jgi:hypothetical protein
MSGLSGIMDFKGVNIITNLKKTLFNKIFWRALKRFSNRFSCVCCPSLVKDRQPTVAEATEHGFMTQIWYSCVWMMVG